MNRPSVKAILKYLDRPATTEDEAIEQDRAYRALEQLVGQAPLLRMNNGDKYLQLCIPVDRLVVGHYYAGKCRNANIAKWDGKMFFHWRHKFGCTFIEDIEYWDVDGHFDGFLPMFDLGSELPAEIVLEACTHCGESPCVCKERMENGVFS
jgi:hypothetical protein